MTRQDGQLVVGRIVGLYGVKGWVKIESYTDPRENIRDYSPWQLMTREGVRTVAIVAVRSQGKRLIAQLETVDTREQAAELMGCEITIQSDQLPDLTDGEHYWRDLIGLKVINQQTEELGEVDSLFETGANDVLVVKQGQHECLIPYIPGQVILEVDLEQGQIYVDWERELE